ncbi:TRI15 [Colletotrichum abscissum]|uniref:TRI15 n=1 Tax=Colletotrichum abscissum TaxID=1671311 RepID=UPI0027D52A7E|nr:TRI15 [Colletotrichum abscissum]KAK1478197.1 TRI15 [Colletotrichum abscissum]
MSELSVSRSIPVAELENATEFLSKRLQEASLSKSDTDEHDTESSGEDTSPQDIFNPSHMLHMQKRHGLSIPNLESLIVDLETLIKYCHLVMVEYKECLYCSSVRNTAQAVRQHMTGKSHCRIDIGKPDSEFRDFYDLGSSCGRDSEDNFGCWRFADSDEDSRELASGKVVSNRNRKKAKNHRKSTQGQRKSSDSLLVGKSSLREDASTALTASGDSKKGLTAAAVKRNGIFEKQLATLRPADRQVLSHLPLPQQRAVVAKAKKQQETWNSEQVAQKMKIQMKAR